MHDATLTPAQMIDSIGCGADGDTTSSFYRYLQRRQGSLEDLRSSLAPLRAEREAVAMALLVQQGLALEAIDGLKELHEELSSPEAKISPVLVSKGARLSGILSALNIQLESQADLTLLSDEQMENLKGQLTGMNGLLVTLAQNSPSVMAERLSDLIFGSEGSLNILQVYINLFAQHSTELDQSLYRRSEHLRALAPSNMTAFEDALKEDADIWRATRASSLRSALELSGVCRGMCAGVDPASSDSTKNIVRDAAGGLKEKILLLPLFRERDLESLLYHWVEKEGMGADAAAFFFECMGIEYKPHSHCSDDPLIKLMEELAAADDVVRPGKAPKEQPEQASGRTGAAEGAPETVSSNAKWEQRLVRNLGEELCSQLRTNPCAWSVAIVLVRCNDQNIPTRNDLKNRLDVCAGELDASLTFLRDCLRLGDEARIVDIRNVLMKPQGPAAVVVTAAPHAASGEPETGAGGEMVVYTAHGLPAFPPLPEGLKEEHFLTVRASIEGLAPEKRAEIILAIENLDLRTSPVPYAIDLLTLSEVERLNSELARFDAASRERRAYEITEFLEAWIPRDAWRHSLTIQQRERIQRVRERNRDRTAEEYEPMSAQYEADIVRTILDAFPKMADGNAIFRGTDRFGPHDITMENARTIFVVERFLTQEARADRQKVYGPLVNDAISAVNDYYATYLLPRFGELVDRGTRVGNQVHFLRKIARYYDTYGRMTEAQRRACLGIIGEMQIDIQGILLGAEAGRPVLPSVAQKLIGSAESGDGDGAGTEI